MSRTNSASRGAARISACWGTATRLAPAGAAPGSAWEVTGSPAKVSPALRRRAVKEGGEEGKRLPCAAWQAGPRASRGF